MFNLPITMGAGVVIAVVVGVASALADLPGSLGLTSGGGHTVQASTITSIEDAQEHVPFDIVKPGYIPEGYELRDLTLIHSPGSGGKVTEDNPLEVIGVMLSYANLAKSTADFTDTFFIEQFNGQRTPNYKVGNAGKNRQESIRGFGTDVWHGTNMDGRGQVILVWSDTDQGVIFNMAGYLTDEETIKVARSLH